MTDSDLYAVAGLNISYPIIHSNHLALDFCLVPIGTGDSSVAEHIAECQRVLEKSGLKYKVHPKLLFSGQVLTSPGTSYSKHSRRGFTPIIYKDFSVATGRTLVNLPESRYDSTPLTFPLPVVRRTMVSSLSGYP